MGCEIAVWSQNALHYVSEIDVNVAVMILVLACVNFILFELLLDAESRK